MPIVDHILRRIGRDARKDVTDMLLPALLVLAGAAVGVAGLGFLAASACLALCTVMGQGLAALLTGSGLRLIASEPDRK